MPVLRGHQAGHRAGAVADAVGAVAREDPPWVAVGVVSADEQPPSFTQAGLSLDAIGPTVLQRDRASGEPHRPPRSRTSDTRPRCATTSPERPGCGPGRGALEPSRSYA